MWTTINFEKKTDVFCAKKADVRIWRTLLDKTTPLRLRTSFMDDLLHNHYTFVKND